MSKILNLDELKIERTIILGGKERKVRSMTVEEFINADEFEEKFKAADGNQDKIRMLVQKVCDFIDDTAVEELMVMELGQLLALLAFIRGDDLGDEKPAEDAGN